MELIAKKEKNKTKTSTSEWLIASTAVVVCALSENLLDACFKISAETQQAPFLLVSSAGDLRVRLSFTLISKQLEGRGIHVKVLPIDFSPAFNTNVPTKSGLGPFHSGSGVIFQSGNAVHNKTHPLALVFRPRFHQRDAGCVHARLSLGSNLLNIQQGSSHNNNVGCQKQKR